MITETILVITASIVGVLGITAFFYSCYKRCPSDRILVIYGMRTRSLSFRCIHGGATFVWPIIQHYQFLDLTPIPLEINLRDAKDKNNIPITLFSILTVGISTSPGVMENAAERLLGVGLAQIRQLGQDIIFGQMRVAIATINIEAINDDPNLLIEKIAVGVEAELTKVGLRLINVNISDVQFKTA